MQWFILEREKQPSASMKLRCSRKGSRKEVVFAVSLYFPWLGLDLVLVTRCMTQCNFLSLLELSFFSFIISSRIVFPASKDRVGQGASRTVKHRPCGSHGSFCPLTPDQERQERWSASRRLGMSVGTGPHSQQQILQWKITPFQAMGFPFHLHVPTGPEKYSFTQLREQRQQTSALGSHSVGAASKYSRCSGLPTTRGRRNPGPTSAFSPAECLCLQSYLKSDKVSPLRVSAKTIR